jgi:hypothetical protein
VNRRHLIALLLAAVALATVGVGCGSSSKSKSSGISKAEFLKRGNAICAKGNKQINVAAHKVFGNNSKKKPTTAQMRKFATTILVPSVASQVNGIRALGAPKGDESKVKAIVDAAQQAVDKGKKDPLALTTNGPGPFAKANKLAKSYGLKACG